MLFFENRYAKIEYDMVAYSVLFNHFVDKSDLIECPCETNLPDIFPVVWIRHGVYFMVDDANFFFECYIFPYDSTQ